MCYFGGGASNCVREFGIGYFGWVRTVVTGVPFPCYRWLEEPFQKYVGGDRVAFCTDAGEDIRRLIVFPSHMVKFEPLEPS